jgi:hypothetical protein
MGMIGGTIVGDNKSLTYKNVRVIEYKEWTEGKGWEDKIFKTTNRMEFDNFIEQLKNQKYVTPYCIYFEGEE